MARSPLYKRNRTKRKKRRKKTRKKWRRKRPTKRRMKSRRRNRGGYFARRLFKITYNNDTKDIWGFYPKSDLISNLVKKAKSAFGIKSGDYDLYPQRGGVPIAFPLHHAGEVDEDFPEKNLILAALLRKADEPVITCPACNMVLDLAPNTPQFLCPACGHRMRADQF